MSILDKKTFKLKVPPQFRVIHGVLQLKMTVYTSRIENSWSFFNFSFCCRDFNEVLLQEKYTKIIDKNRLELTVFRANFLGFPVLGQTQDGTNVGQTNVGRTNVGRTDIGQGQTQDRDKRRIDKRRIGTNAGQDKRRRGTFPQKTQDNFKLFIYSI